MSKTMTGLALVLSLGAPMSGCNIENCEQGADCTDDVEKWEPPDSRGTQQCLAYCNRLNVCGAPQAEDFDGCVAACEVRFEKLPRETAELCACITESRCEDAIDGRCTPPGDGAGGSHGGGAGQGGSSTSGGSSSTGGSTSSTGGSSNGSGGSSGSTQTGGSSGTGGTPSSGGSSASAGTAACSGEPSAGSAGDSSSAGTGAGPGGAGGDDPGVACTCDCDCTAEQACVDGYCSG